MTITGTQINYFQICHRKLWLFSNGIQMEQHSELVAIGKHIEEHTYKQRSFKHKEISIGPIKLDYYDAKKRIIKEVKKSNKMSNAHEFQLKYYLYILESIGLKKIEGRLEYPKLKETKSIVLSDEDRWTIKSMIQSIKTVIASEHCPKKIHKPMCKKCAYYDFCYINEEVISEELFNF